MTTYSGEDGMTGTDEPGAEPSPYGTGVPDAQPPAPGDAAAPFPYVPFPTSETAHDDSAYNATDVLPTEAPGGRRARRQAAEEEARATTPPRGPKAVVNTTPSGPGRAIVPIAIALVCGVALAAAWLHLQSDSTDETAAPISSVSASPEVSTSPSTVASSSPSTAPSASASAKPSASSSPTTKPSASTTAVPAVVDRSVPVVVLNATGRSGLAAKVAAKLRAEGWKVTSVGNWTKGGITATTIYLNGHTNARATMIKDLPAADGRVELPLAGMPKLRLVVVIGKDYPA